MGRRGVAKDELDQGCGRRSGLFAKTLNHTYVVQSGTLKDCMYYHILGSSRHAIAELALLFETIIDWI
jgi:hypothetical protein